MKLLNLALVAAMSITYSVSNAQNSVALDSKRTQVNRSSSDVNDEYMGMKDKILTKLNVSEIPADFPKFTKGMNDQEYKNSIKAWMDKNEQYWSAEYKKKRATKDIKREEARKRATQSNQ